MKKAPSMYKWFDYVELSLFIPSFFGTIASFYGLWYTLKKTVIPPWWLIITFVLVIIFTVWAFLIKMTKFKVQNARNIAKFCGASHSICHEMRNHFFELFDKWHINVPIDVKGTQETITDYGAQLLSSAIHDATGANTTVVIKVFTNKLPLNEKTGNSIDIREKLENLDLKMITKSNYSNGNKSDFLPGEVELKNHSLYVYALADILSAGTLKPARMGTF